MTDKVHQNPRNESSERSRRLAPEAGALEVGLSAAAVNSLDDPSTSHADASSSLSPVAFVVTCADAHFKSELLSFN